MFSAWTLPHNRSAAQRPAQVAVDVLHTGGEGGAPAG
jgi:hypothetical protein